MHRPVRPSRWKAKPPRQAPAAIDTSTMSAGKRAAVEMAESARQVEWEGESFAAGLFDGRPRFELMHPFPAQPMDDVESGAAFLAELHDLLRDEVDADTIDRTGEVPQRVIDRLAEIGAFGMKIERDFGGLGLSQSNYLRAAMLLGSTCGNLTALLSAHQSIGVPQPLIMFGTAAQRREYLPRVAGGEMSAFALTETNVGSDPARLETTATPTPDGEHYVINGRKLWCTNGTRAGVIVLMARTPTDHAPGDGHGVHRRVEHTGREHRASLPVHGAAGAVQRRAEV